MTELRATGREARRERCRLCRSRIPRSPADPAQRPAAALRRRNPDPLRPSRRAPQRVRLPRFLAAARGRGRRAGDRAGIHERGVPRRPPGTISAICATRSGAPNPRAAWTYGVDARLFEALRAQGVTSAAATRCSAIRRAGSSCTACSRSASAIASWRRSPPMPAPTPCPISTIAFPYGLGETGLDQADLDALLRFRLTVMAGTADIDTASEHFPKEAAGDGAGRHAARARASLCRECARRRPRRAASRAAGPSSTCLTSAMTASACRPRRRRSSPPRCMHQNPARAFHLRWSRRRPSPPPGPPTVGYCRWGAGWGRGPAPT